MHTANAANAGAQRGHSRRTSAPGRSTAGSPALEEPPVGGPPLRDFLRRPARSCSDGTVAGYFGVVT